MKLATTSKINRKHGGLRGMALNQDDDGLKTSQDDQDFRGRQSILQN